MASRKGIGRRALVGGGAVAISAGLLEWASLRGHFDHRRGAGASAKARYAASLEAIEQRPRAEPAVVHVGHSTHLLALGGVRILTDPWFFDPAFGALSHEHPPAVLPSELGRLDVILVTHDHADHADMRAMDQMDKRALVLVATSALAARAKLLGFRDVGVLAPWEERTEKDVVFAAVPALHDIYEIGFVVRVANKSMYFAGDTRLHPDLPAIAERYHPDVAILPVDGTRLVGGALHVMNPEDAITAARTLGSKLVIPSHAEAVFSDPLVAAGLASTVDRARFVFGEKMAAALPGARCVVPEPGQLVSL